MNAPADEIHVASLELSAHIGVTEAEQAHPQRLTVSLTLRPSGGFTELHDRIENALDYADVCATVRALALDRPRRLIETLAEEIAQAVLGTYAHCAAVEVELRKYVLADTLYVAARLMRTRDLVSAQPS